MAWGASSASSPPPLPANTDDKAIASNPQSQNPARKSNMWDRLSLHKLGGWLRKEETESLPDLWEKPPPPQEQDLCDEKKPERPGLLGRKRSRTVIPGLPRPMTFKRQELEKRDRLVPDEPGHSERRAFSVDRRRHSGARRRTLSPQPSFPLRQSAPDSLSPYNNSSTQESLLQTGRRPTRDKEDDDGPPQPPDASWGYPPPLSATGELSDNDALSEGVDEHIIQEELDAKWILNLSMHFRDLTDREKFFVTYAEEPNRWRRVTISIDYRGATPGSLEAELKSLHYQRDKSARIYEAIRDSLPDIQFYDTVTNLKLQTDDGRLHVHVTEDMNEIIPYPPVSAVAHLECPSFRESDVRFESHLSGFVYKISVAGRIYIKKEIPGPEAVEEFLYETNTLSRLRGSQSVIEFAGVITDDREEQIVGLLISHAEKGALVDMLYDWKTTKEMMWPRRERWAKQIVQGLSEIHESGFVQGDFTLSNIVINSNDDAKIIDINRRGCPVGWEPPELAKLIESGQRIGIYIGIKSDLFQLGMVLWALAEEQDEPERQERPLAWTIASEGVPTYFKEIVEACLSENPRNRLSAKELLAKFPDIDPHASKPGSNNRHSISTHRSDKEYIDPRTAVGHEDIDQYRRTHASTEREVPSSLNPSSTNFSYIAPPTDYEAESSGSYIVGGRGRSPGGDRRAYENSPFFRPQSASALSLDDSEELASPPPEHEPRWQQIYIDGDTRLVHRGSMGVDDQDFAAQEQATVCISTPTSELNNPFPLESAESAQVPASSDYPDLAGIHDMPPPPLPAFRERPLRNNRSFNERASHDDILADLAQEVDVGRDGDDYVPPRFHFSPPVHQDSGFHELGADLPGFDADIAASSHHDDMELELNDMVESAYAIERQGLGGEHGCDDQPGSKRGPIREHQEDSTTSVSTAQKAEPRPAAVPEIKIDPSALSATLRPQFTWPAQADKHLPDSGEHVNCSASLALDFTTPAAEPVSNDLISPSLSTAEATVSTTVPESVFDHYPTSVTLAGLAKARAEQLVQQNEGDAVLESDSVVGSSGLGGRKEVDGGVVERGQATDEGKKKGETI